MYMWSIKKTKLVSEIIIRYYLTKIPHAYTGYHINFCVKRFDTSVVERQLKLKRLYQDKNL